MKYKKLSAVVLSVAMIVTVLPAIVFADENNPCAHLNKGGTYDCSAKGDKADVCSHDDECGYAVAKASVTDGKKDKKAGKETAQSKTTAKEPALRNGAKTITKRTRALELAWHSTITDNDGNVLTAVNGVYDMLDTEGWKFDKNTNTLTLNGADIDVSSHLAILMADDVTIEVAGANSVKGTSSGIDTGLGSMTIKGDGTLTVNTTQVCIAASEDLIVKSGTLNLTSQQNSTLYAVKNIIVSGGVLDLKSQNASAVSTFENNIIISGGTVNASGYYCGLLAKGSINISGGKVIAASSNDCAIFTKGNLSISDSANVTATESLYAGMQANGNITITDSKVDVAGGTNTDNNSRYPAIFTPQTITINGTSKVTADGDYAGIRADKLIRLCGSADIIVTGQNEGLMSEDVKISEGAEVQATSTSQSAITGSKNLSITGNAVVTARGKICGILAGDALTLSAKNVKAYSEDNYAVCNTTAKDISISGKLTAESKSVSAIRSQGTITADSKANITATGGWCGIESDGNISFAGSTVEAIGKKDDGIYSTGTIRIDGGNIHAKGSPIHAGIRAEAVQASGETAAAKITISSLVEKNGGKVAFSDWNNFETKPTSWTSFIAKADTRLNVKADGSMDNALNEVWLVAPYIHTHSPAADDGDCTTPILCTTCGDVVTPAKSHNFTGSWQKDADTHWHNCGNAGCTKTADKTAHTWDSGVITTQPTEEKDGVKTFTCTICNQTKTESVKLPTKEEVVDPETGSKVEYEDGTKFDETVELVVTPQPSKEINKYEKAVDKIAKGSAIANLYDVKLLKNGVVIQPGGKVKVTIKQTKEMKAMKDLQVVYIDDTGKVTIIPSQISGDKIVFVTDHFSYYGVIGKQEAKVAAPKTVAARGLSKSTVRVAWSKVSKATEYAVYKASSQKGTYTLEKKVKGITATIGGLKSGKTYYFKVRAKGGAGYSGYSKIVSAKTKAVCPCGEDHSKAWFKLKQSGKSTVKVTWTSQKNARYYQVANNHTNNKAMKIKWTGSNKQNCYLSLGKSKGKNYQFKMRTVTVKNGKKAYGPWTSKVCITMK